MSDFKERLFKSKVRMYATDHRGGRVTNSKYIAVRVLGTSTPEAVAKVEEELQIIKLEALLEDE